MTTTVARGREARAEWYDHAFRTQASWRVPYWRSEYFVLWARLIARLEPGCNILELGCGTGQLAAFLSACGYRNYRGIDFSMAAIDMACDASDMEFSREDVYDYEWIEDYAFDTIIATEFFEHVRDIEIIERIPSSTRILFTLPSFMAQSHLRAFQSEGQIRARYDPFIEIADVVPDSQLFRLVDGVRR